MHLEGTASGPEVGDKTLKDLAVEDLETLDMSQLEKAREQQARKERDGLIRQRKGELKRVDHTARALREEEVKIFPAWQEKEAADITRMIQNEQEKKLKAAAVWPAVEESRAGWPPPADYQELNPTEMEAPLQEPLRGADRTWL